MHLFRQIKDALRDDFSFLSPSSRVSLTREHLLRMLLYLALLLVLGRIIQGAYLLLTLEPPVPGGIPLQPRPQEPGSNEPIKDI